ncbi:MAG: CocE/NonD family hydrolase, partial [bacterium]|nr:CocE/NonD family hydrolase [bacterium]
MEPDRTETMTTRDGVALVADLFLPDTSPPVPIILMRSPYDRTSVLTRKMIDIRACLQRGYAVVIQDTRGRFESEGVFSPFYQEIDDADDTLDWLAGREFCDG